MRLNSVCQALSIKRRACASVLICSLPTPNDFFLLFNNSIENYTNLKLVILLLFTAWFFVNFSKHIIRFIQKNLTSNPPQKRSQKILIWIVQKFKATAWYYLYQQVNSVKLTSLLKINNIFIHKILKMTPTVPVRYFQYQKSWNNSKPTSHETFLFLF